MIASCAARIKVQTASDYDAVCLDSRSGTLPYNYESWKGARQCRFVFGCTARKQPFQQRRQGGLKRGDHRGRVPLP